MLLLFFLDPNNPCINSIGEVFWSAIGVGGLCRSYARGTGPCVDELNLVLAMEGKVKLRGLTRRSRTGAGPIIFPPHLLIHETYVQELEFGADAASLETDEFRNFRAGDAGVISEEKFWWSPGTVLSVTSHRESR